MNKPTARELVDALL